MIILEILSGLLVAILLGFIVIRAAYYIVVRCFIYVRLLRKTLRYLDKNGRGYDDCVNETAMSAHLGGRVRTVILVAAFYWTIAVVVIAALLRLDKMTMAVGVSATIGSVISSLAFIYILTCIEAGGKMVCGRLVAVVPSMRWATIVTNRDTMVLVNYQNSNIRESDLVCGKKYFIAECAYMTVLGPCDCYEWTEQKYPSGFF